MRVFWADTLASLTEKICAMKALFAKSFIGFYLAQSLGAFNDNFYRNALVLLINFAFIEQLGNLTASMAAISAAIFMMPFFLCSATAGRLADRMDKARLVQWLKWTELLVMILAVLGFWLMQLWLLLVALFFMGMQSAFFGPVKYSIIPQLAPKSSLLAANAAVEATTFVVILLGTIVSSVMMLNEDSRMLVAFACIGFSLLGVLSSHMIKPLPAPLSSEKWHWHIGRDIAGSLTAGWSVKPLRYPLIGIAWFWGIGTVCLTQIPFFVTSQLPNATHDLPYLLAAFTLGIAFGATACAIWQKGQINDRTAMLGAGLMALAAIDFLWASQHIPTDGFPIRLALDLFALSASAGLIAVPLYTLLQHSSADDVRGRIIASSNVVNALIMTGLSVISAIALGSGIGAAFIMMLWPLLTLPLLWVARKKWGE